MAGKRTRSSGSPKRAPAAAVTKPVPVAPVAATPKPAAPKPAAKKAALVFRSPFPALRITTTAGTVEFVDGAYTAPNEQIAAALSRVADDRPDLLAKDG